MSTVDFAAAQARILARRRAAAHTHSPLTSTTPASPPSAALLALPAPLRTLLQQSFSSLSAFQSPYGTRPAFRVGQVDAELLDAELLTLFRGQISDGLRHFGTHLADDWGAEIGALLRVVLWKLSIWDTGVSYGGRLQGLKYVDARGRKGEEKDVGKWQRILYGMVTVGGRYGWEKWEDWLLDREGTLEYGRWTQRLGRASKWLSSTHDVAAFVGFLVFLYNGRYRTLVDRALRMRLVPTTAQTTREVSFEYLNRQLVWHAFTEFLLFILPLVGISRWRRWLTRAWRKVKSTVTRRREDEDEELARGELGFLPERTCAICYKDQNPTAGASEADVMAASSGGGGVIGSAQTDVTNPYEAIPCGDVYCFSCLAQRIEAEDGEGWTCLRCGEVVKECKPWSGDVIDETASRSTSGSKGSRKSVVFVDNEEDEDIQQEEEELIERTLTPVEPMPLEDGAEHDEVQSARDTIDEDAELFGRPNKSAYKLNM
ncbi:hypothetical protein K461DRAFT_328201 [Myriangium duriaei CBS 260.36]|uniref:Pex N-terminal domain-containing protein n=1 Tax=Myriangium duriaei CBS 260.36 TaxID=1168546 RepID=A0A9P4IXF1_9PEZI|nr:hypothetical protein K461DRAFT_328201 [Myriangium duriaei CBS 260.36]